jgi:multiple sugar transport system substrate-binding protein
VTAQRVVHRKAEMAIDPGAPIPIYFQLKTVLLEDILSGRYGPDDRLPTEHELCAAYGISRTPVHRALSELAEEGVILRRRRRGTFVNPHLLRRRPERPAHPAVVPEGPWEALVRRAAPPDLAINVARVALPDLHQVLSHAVAEGRQPGLQFPQCDAIVRLINADRRLRLNRSMQNSEQRHQIPLSG